LHSPLGSPFTNLLVVMCWAASPSTSIRMRFPTTFTICFSI